MDRNRSRERIELSKDDVEGLFSLLPDLACIASADGYFKKLNPLWEETLGYTVEELLNSPFITFVHPEDIEHTLQEGVKIFNGEPAINLVNRYRCKDGSYKWLEWRTAPTRNKSHVLATARDITERRQGEEKYSLLFDRMLNGFAICEIICDAAGRPVNFRFLEVNPAFERNMGLKNAGVTGRTVLELLPETEEYWIERYGKVALTGEPMSFTAFHSGVDKHFQIAAFSLGHGQFAVIFDDVTSRVRMEQSLLESVSREKARAAELGALMEAVPATVLIAHDPECRLVTGNLAAYELLRMPPGGNLSKSAPDGERPSHYRIFKNGVETAFHELPVQRAARGEDVRDYEQEFVFEDGSRRILLGNATPLRDEMGRLCGAVSTFVDITELKHAREEMHKSQKLESLGVLAGGIAHDFNNILTAILGNISLARMQLHDTKKTAKRLIEAENAASRAKDLTQQLLTFARGGEPVKKVIEAGALLKEAAGFAIHGSTVRCEFALADGLWPVEVDEGQLSQVIHNLVINAVQAMPDGGTITIGAENLSSVPEGQRCVRIFVADNGTGIPEEHLQRIFDPYFTTKQQGSGLGLATCYSIIKKHGGIITVESTLGKGSTFNLTLPVSKLGREAQPEFQTDVAYGIGRVLVMDDEEPVRKALQAMLDELGYTAECAENGAEAVDLYRKRKEEGKPFAAVILDLTIPGGVGGKEAITTLLKIDPDVKAIVSSGYSTDPVMANYLEYGFSAVLTKPYLLQDMSRVFQELLTC
jgi:PAS domain S-box-containing protein